jgi:hypothetical protein
MNHSPLLGVLRGQAILCMINCTSGAKELWLVVSEEAIRPCSKWWKVTKIARWRKP